MGEIPKGVQLDVEIPLRNPIPEVAHHMPRQVGMVNDKLRIFLLNAGRCFTNQHKIHADGPLFFNRIGEDSLVRSLQKLTDFGSGLLYVVEMGNQPVQAHVTRRLPGQFSKGSRKPER